MAREVRITIDDDEVFERMKARKRELDLSWEEVLKRGLREDDRDTGRHEAGGAGDGIEFRWEPGEAAAAFREDTDRERRPGARESTGGFVEEIKDQVQNQVRESLRASVDSMSEAKLEVEMTELEEAEDAVLRFDDVTGDGRRYTVPLRVRLETSRGGLDVDVVAVRTGKSVADANRFDREARRAVNEHLARGGTATLAFADGEAYEVGPVLSWSHEDDHPTVAAVEIEEVLFDDE